MLVKQNKWNSKASRPSRADSIRTVAAGLHRQEHVLRHRASDTPLPGVEIDNEV
jgi:hypothetical protein